MRTRFQTRLVLAIAFAAILAGIAQGLPEAAEATADFLGAF